MRTPVRIEITGNFIQKEKSVYTFFCDSKCLEKVKSKSLSVESLQDRTQALCALEEGNVGFPDVHLTQNIAAFAIPFDRSELFI